MEHVVPYLGTVDFSVQSGSSWSQGFRIWVDWNQDDDFYDAGEDVWNSVGASTNAYTGSFTVPANALPGSTRIRVRCTWNNVPGDPCTNLSFGETEDYTLTILPPALTALITDSIGLLCYGDSTATLAPAVFGGSTPYTYLWSNSSTDSALYNMPAGSYSVIVTDDSSDTDTAYVVVWQPDSITSSASVTSQLVCDYDTSEAVAIGMGGTAYGNYSIDTTSSNFNPDTTMVGTVLNIDDEDVVGNLDIGFDFEFFGTSYNTFSISDNGFITFDVSTNAGCCAGQNIPNAVAPNNLIALAWDDLNTGQAGATVSYYTAGTAPYRRLIVNFANVPFFFNTTPGVTAQAILYETSNCIEIHSALVGNATGATQGIEGPGGVEAYTYPDRNNDNWSASEDFISFCPIDTSGLLYTWSNGSVGNTVSGLAPGTHTVTVSDVNGCQNTHEVVIDNPVSALVSNTVSTDVTCFGVADGTIDPDVTGGVTPLDYTWSNSETTATLSDLGPGSYSVFVEDNVGCTIEVNNIVINEPSILIAVVNGVENVLCPGDTTGSATAVAAGGIPPYTYSWLPIGAGGQSVAGLTNGTYNLLVTDDNGCESYSSVSVLAQSSTPSVDLGPDIFDPNGGTATLDAGTHTSYNWNTSATSQTITVTQTGTYWVEVTNADGCVGTDSISIEIWPTGVKELATSHIKVYPNPASDVLQFELGTEVSDITVQIIDSRGAIVANQQLVNDGLTSMNVSNLPNGVYTLSIAHGNEVLTHRLSIVH